MRITSRINVLGMFPLMLGGLFVLLAVESDVLAAPPAAETSTEIPQWVELFNGRDLSGWANVNTDPDTWTVKGGVGAAASNGGGYPISSLLQQIQVGHAN